MGTNFPPWLTKQMIRGIRGFNLDTYLVALEGWRRGLSLKWYLDPTVETNLEIIGFNPLGKSFSLSSEDQTHFFYRSRGDKVVNKTVDICTNKKKTKEILSEAGVPIPKGKGFMADTPIDVIINYGLSLGFPLVVKPTFGSLGKGVTTNITTEKQLKEGIEHARDIGYDEVIVEQHVQGEDYRLYIVNEEVVGVTNRIPANVIGDGRHTIQQLIDIKNEQRKENPYLRTKLIKVDDEVERMLHHNNLHINDILKENERVFLRKVANIAAGGDPIEAIDMLTPEIKEIAINTLKAMPGLTHAGIDILVHGGECVVLEINPTADISMHIFPMTGEPINIPECILNYYFPTTRGMALGNEKLYFDYRKIRRLLLNGLVQGYQITDATHAPLYAKRYIVSGKVQKVGYRRWIQREAIRQGLHGYTRNLRNGNVVVVVGGDQDKVDGFKLICQRGSKRTKVKGVKEFSWKGQIKIGFEIRRSR